MEPLPSQGQTLRHFTASRPRPRRTHTQPPSSRTQEPALKSEDEATDGMGRVDEGVEEFFTKRIIPDYSLKGQWEESNPAQAPPLEPSLSPSASTPVSPSSDNITSSTVTPLDSSLTCSDVPPSPSPASPPTSPSVTSSSSAALPSKNIKKKFGDFFAFKRPRTGRAAKAGGAEGGEAGKVKRTSIADLIRPLRDAKDRDRERARDKHRDANLSNDAAVTEGTAASSRHLDGDAKEAVDPDGTSAPAAEIAPSHPTIATTPDLTDATLSDLQKDGVSLPPFLPECAQTPSGVTPPSAEPLRTKLPSVEGTVERRVKKTFREGKSQSLILLSGLEPEDKDGTHSKKCVSDGTSSFEHRLQVMLHRMGVTKTPPADSKHSQNKDEELRKANSEGAILEKPGPPVKPRTMSTSSADPRHPVKVLDPIRPELHPHLKPIDRPSGPLPPKPAVAAKPPLPLPTPPAGDTASSSSAPLRVQLRPHVDPPAPSEERESPQGPSSAASPRKEPFPTSPSPWSAQQRSEKAQSVTAENLLKPRPHLKPLTQRRAVSVHEDALAMTQELKSVLQRSPVRFQGNRGDLPTFKEDPSSTEDVPVIQDAPSTGATRDERPTSDPSSLKSPERSTCHEGSTGSVPELPCKVEAPASTVGPETPRHPHVGPPTPRSPGTVEVDLRNSTQRTVDVILTRHIGDQSEPRT
ncbi:capping protein, Arp2/3 and myosin-I linker protein 2-like [Neosynchiropus ocellatus]